jgi:hypothetical protein
LLPRLSCAGVLLLGLAGCDQPTGVVIKVSGASDASDLWLTVGADASADEARFFESSAESGLVKSKAGLAEDVEFSDGFEIYLDSADLRKQGKVALVLDAIIDGTPPDIRRDSYAVTPDSEGLIEVKLAPKKIGDGKWVCAGQTASDTAPGFIVSLDDNDTDCDRDGWSYRTDSDDTDPLDAPKPTWGITVNPPGCAVKLGDRVLRSVSACGICQEPTDRDALDQCLGNLAQIKCTIGTKTAAFNVGMLARPLPSNPSWELITLGPMNAKAFFAPSIKAPNQWAVVFQLGEMNVGWFQLNDRSPGGASRLVRVDYQVGNANRCEQQ